MTLPNARIEIVLLLPDTALSVWEGMTDPQRDVWAVQVIQGRSPKTVAAEFSKWVMMTGNAKGKVE